MTELEKIELDLSQLDEGLSDLERKLNPLLSFKTIDAISENLSLLDQAKLNVSMAYSLNSLYFRNPLLFRFKMNRIFGKVYMKLNSIPTESHKINQENVFFNH